MKSSLSYVRAGIVPGACLLLLALSGCGQKGPLYMPRIPPDPRVGTAAPPKPPAARADGAADSATDSAADSATSRPVDGVADDAQQARPATGGD